MDEKDTRLYRMSCIQSISNWYVYWATMTANDPPMLLILPSYEAISVIARVTRMADCTKVERWDLMYTKPAFYSPIPK